MVRGRAGSCGGDNADGAGETDLGCTELLVIVVSGRGEVEVDGMPLELLKDDTLSVRSFFDV